VSTLLIPLYDLPRRQTVFRAYGLDGQMSGSEAWMPNRRVPPTNLSGTKFELPQAGPKGKIQGCIL